MRLHNIKIFVCIVSLLLVSSCDTPQEKEISVPKSRMDSVLDNLVTKYPNYNSNTYVRDKASLEMMSLIDSNLNHGCLETIPLHISSIKKNPYGIGAIVHFYTDEPHNLLPERLLSSKVKFDIITFMDTALASSLSELVHYTIRAHNYKRLTAAQADLLVNTRWFGDESEIKGEEMHLGNFAAELDSVKIFEP